VTGMSLVCKCGREAEDGDIECSLCGRDLSSLRPPAPPLSRPASYGTYASSYGADRPVVPPAPDRADFHTDYDHRYADPAASADAGVQPPTYGLATSLTAPAPALGAPMTSRRRGVAGIAIGACAIVAAGFALGYFAIAGLLTG
jgi:hypothetical protein